MWAYMSLSCAVSSSTGDGRLTEPELNKNNVVLVQLWFDNNYVRYVAYVTSRDAHTDHVILFIYLADQDLLLSTVQAAISATAWHLVLLMVIFITAKICFN